MSEIKDAAQWGQRERMKANVTAAAGRRKRTGHGADPLGPNSEIGRKLRQYYDELVSEEVPDKFADLLKQLETSEQTASSRDGD